MPFRSQGEYGHGVEKSLLHNVGFIQGFAVFAFLLIPLTRQ